MSSMVFAWFIVGAEQSCEQSTYSSPPTPTPRSSMLCCSRDSGRLGLRALRYKTPEAAMDDRGRQAGLRGVEILTFMAGKTPRRPVHRENCVRRSTNIKANTPSSTIRCAAVGRGLVCPELPDSRCALSTGRSRTWSWRVALSSICRRAESSPVVSLLRSDLSVPYAVRPYVRLDRVRHPLSDRTRTEKRTRYTRRRDRVVCKSDREDLISLGCLSSVKVTSPLSPAAAMDHVAMPRRVARPSHFHQVARLTHSLQELSIPCGQGTGPV